MGDAGHQQADGVHLLGLEQLLLESFVLGRVPDAHEQAALTADLDPADLDLGREGRAVMPTPKAGPPGRSRRADEATLFVQFGCTDVGKRRDVDPDDALAEHLERCRIRVDDDVVEGFDDEGVRRLLEEGPIPVLGRDRVRSLLKGGL